MNRKKAIVKKVKEKKFQIALALFATALMLASPLTGIMFENMHANYIGESDKARAKTGELAGLPKKSDNIYRHIVLEKKYPQIELKNGENYTIEFKTFNPTDLYSCSFEQDNGTWEAVQEGTIIELTEVVKNTGKKSLYIKSTQDKSTLSAGFSTGGWYLDAYPYVQFASKIPPNVPVGILFYVADYDWLCLGGTSKHDHANYPASGNYYLYDDNEWHVYLFNLRKHVRTVWPNATKVTDMRFWTKSNAMNSMGFWIDDLRVANTTDDVGGKIQIDIKGKISVALKNNTVYDANLDVMVDNAPISLSAMNPMGEASQKTLLGWVEDEKWYAENDLATIHGCEREIIEKTMDRKTTGGTITYENYKEHIKLIPNARYVEEVEGFKIYERPFARSLATHVNPGMHILKLVQHATQNFLSANLTIVSVSSIEGTNTLIVDKEKILSSTGLTYNFHAGGQVDIEIGGWIPTASKDNTVIASNVYIELDNQSIQLSIDNPNGSKSEYAAIGEHNGVEWKIKPELSTITGNTYEVCKNIVETKVIDGSTWTIPKKIVKLFGNTYFQETKDGYNIFLKPVDSSISVVVPEGEHNLHVYANTPSPLPLPKIEYIAISERVIGPEPVKSIQAHEITDEEEYKFNCSSGKITIEVEGWIYSAAKNNTLFDNDLTFYLDSKAVETTTHNPSGSETNTSFIGYRGEQEWYVEVDTATIHGAVYEQSDAPAKEGEQRKGAVPFKDSLFVNEENNIIIFKRPFRKKITETMVEGEHKFAIKPSRHPELPNTTISRIMIWREPVGEEVKYSWEGTKTVNDTTTFSFSASGAVTITIEGIIYSGLKNTTIYDNDLLIKLDGKELDVERDGEGEVKDNLSSIGFSDGKEYFVEADNATIHGTSYRIRSSVIENNTTRNLVDPVSGCEYVETTNDYKIYKRAFTYSSPQMLSTDSHTIAIIPSIPQNLPAPVVTKVKASKMKDSVGITHLKTWSLGEINTTVTKEFTASGLIYINLEGEIGFAVKNTTIYDVDLLVKIDGQPAALSIDNPSGGKEKINSIGFNESGVEWFVEEDEATVHGANYQSELKEQKIEKENNITTFVYTRNATPLASCEFIKEVNNLSYYKHKFTKEMTMLVQGGTHKLEIIPLFPENIDVNTLLPKITSVTIYQRTELNTILYNDQTIEVTKSKDVTYKFSGEGLTYLCVRGFVTYAVKNNTIYSPGITLLADNEPLDIELEKGGLNVTGELVKIGFINNTIWYANQKLATLTGIGYQEVKTNYDIWTKDNTTIYGNYRPEVRVCGNARYIGEANGYQLFKQPVEIVVSVDLEGNKSHTLAVKIEIPQALENITKVTITLVSAADVTQSTVAWGWFYWWYYSRWYWRYYRRSWSYGWSGRWSRSYPWYYSHRWSPTHWYVYTGKIYYRYSYYYRVYYYFVYFHFSYYRSCGLSYGYGSWWGSVRVSYHSRLSVSYTYYYMRYYRVYSITFYYSLHYTYKFVHGNYYYYSRYSYKYYYRYYSVTSYVRFYMSYYVSYYVSYHVRVHTRWWSGSWGGSWHWSRHWSRGFSYGYSYRYGYSWHWRSYYSKSGCVYGTISINSDATYTTNPTVTLNLHAWDTGGGEIYYMRFSNDGSSWSGWEGYRTSKIWTLPSGDGKKIVYVQYRNWIGAEYTASDTIILDTTPPTGSITIEVGP